MSDLYTRLRRIKEQRRRTDLVPDAPRAGYLSPGLDWREGAPGVFARETRHPVGGVGGYITRGGPSSPTLSPLLRVGESGRLLAIDIETTGLSAGAGNVAFLVGLGELDPVGVAGEAAEIHLTQLFLGDFDAEPALLLELERLLDGTPPTIYVTYNGSRFDIPVLRSRFLLNRRVFPEALHLDVLHPARRLYGAELENCTLGNVERRVLGVQRSLDIPGAEVPERYLEYLRYRRTDRLDEVFAHHESDVVNVLRLALLINHELWSAAEGDGSGDAGDPTGDDLERDPVVRPDPISLARFLLEGGGDPAAARAILLRLRDRSEARRLRREESPLGYAARRLGSGLPRGWVESRTHLAAIARREGDWNLMAEVLGELLRIRGTLADAEEMAKYWEHRRRDPARALAVLTEARDRTGEWSPSAEYRAARLMRKLGVPWSG